MNINSSQKCSCQFYQFYFFYGIAKKWRKKKLIWRKKVCFGIKKLKKRVYYRFKIIYNVLIYRRLVCIKKKLKKSDFFFGSKKIVLPLHSQNDRKKGWCGGGVLGTDLWQIEQVAKPKKGKRYKKNSEIRKRSG